MPTKTRDKLIQSYERCQGAYDRALYHLGQMRNTYGDGYPEHKEAVETVGLATMKIKELLQQFRQQKM